MFNPLTSAASQVVPVQPTTSFFDTSASLGVMERYGMSAGARSAAEEGFKSMAGIAATSHQLRALDREDLAYEEKRDFENTLGQFVIGLAQLDEDADDFDEKVAGMLADPRALDNETVRAIYNLKVQQRSEKTRLREVAAERNAAILESWSRAGFAPADITDETGMFDSTRAATAKRMQSAVDGLRQQADEARKLWNSDFKDDPMVRDAPSRERAEQLLQTRSNRLKQTAQTANTTLYIQPGSQDWDELLKEAGDLSLHEFVASVVNYTPDEAQLGAVTDRTERILWILARGGETDPKLAPFAKALIGVHNAAVASRLLPSARGDGQVTDQGSVGPPAAAAPVEDPENDELFRQLGVDPRSASSLFGTGE
jgi:hypothetical protein